MATVGQKRRALLEQLKSTQERSQGRIGPGQTSQVGRLGVGVARGLTRPLDIFGLAMEPSYGPQGPGVAGTIGELAGSIAPYLLGEAALARVLPLLRGRGLIPSAARSATSFGLVEFGAPPPPGETRTGQAVRGALTGAIIGASIAPKLGPRGEVLAEASIGSAALGGAAATAVPLGMGDEIAAPVEITGNETADLLIFNAALAGALQAVGRRLTSHAPPPELSESPPPLAQPPPLPPTPITDPARLLRPRTFYQPPAPTVEAPAPARTILESVSAPAPPTAQPIESALFGGIARPEPVQLELPGIVEGLRKLGPIEPFALPRRSRLDAKLEARGIRLAQALPIENVREVRDTFEGRVPSETPVLVARGMEMGEIRQSARRGFFISDKALLPSPSRSVRQGRGDPRPIIWVSADPRVANAYGEFFAIFDVAGLPVTSSVRPSFGRLERGIAAWDEGASAAIRAPIPLERLRFIGRWTSENNFEPISLQEFSLERLSREMHAVIEPPKPSLLIRLVRSADEQNALEAKAAEIKASARVAKGRQIPLDELTAEALPEGLPGVDKAKRLLDTTGLGLDDVNKLIDEADTAADDALVLALQRTRAGLSGKGKKKGVVHDRQERPRTAVASQVVEQAESRALSPEEQLIRRRGEAGLDEGVESAVDASERRLLEIESDDILPGEMHNRSRKFVFDLVRVKQAKSGDVYSYSNMLKAMKDMRTPIVGVEGDKFKVVLPDETIATLSKDEIIARIEASLPPTNAVPMYQGADVPPIAQPVQLVLPGIPEGGPKFTLPEPSAMVILKSAEREAGTGSLADRIVQGLDSGEPRILERISDGEFAALPAVDRARIVDAIERRQARQPKDRSVMFPLAPEEIKHIVERRKGGGLPEGGTERRGVAESKVAATAPPKPTTVRLKPTDKSIDAFLKERGIERTAKRIPPRHKAAFVKGEAASKAMEVDVSPQGVVVTDHVSGKKTRVKNLDEAARVVASSPNNEGPMRTDDELRSIFRRGFAGAKNNAHRNNIRRKYKLYAAYFPRAGEALRQGETPLASMGGLINHRVPPTVDLTPASAGGGRINLPPGPPPIPPSGGPMATEHIPFGDLRGMGWTRYFRPMKFWALGLEERSKGFVPAYTKLFAPLDEARQEMQVFLSSYYPELVKAWKPFARDVAARERIGHYLEAPDKAAAIREFGISPGEVKAATKLRELWTRLFKDLGYEDSLEFIENYLPWRRINLGLSEAQALEQFYRNRAVPRSYVVGHQLERTTNGEFARQRDAFKLFHEYLFQGSRDRFLAAPHAKAVELVNGMSLPSNLEPVRKHLTNFVDRMWGTTDASNKALGDFIDGLMTKLGVHADKEFRTDFVSMLLQLNVGAHMGWRAPLAIRNAFQIFFVYPMVGERSFAVGLRKALTAEGKAEAVRMKVIGNDPVPFGDEIFNPFSTLTRVVRASLKAYSRVDDLTRSVAYHATKDKMLRAAEKYRANNWTIARFVEEAELDSIFHPVEAKQIADMVKAGNPIGAAERAGYLMQENTNFIYRAGNQPEAFRGVAGRLFGQFGVWPVSYVEYLRYLSTFGTPNQRAAKIARFMAINTAFGAAGTMLGVNTWKWLLFGPVAFTGGPMLQLAQDAGKVVSSTLQGRSDDPEAAMAASRLKRNVPATFIPGSGLVRDIEAIIEESRRGAGPAVIRALSGQSPEATFSSLPRSVRRRALVERVRSGPSKPPSRSGEPR